jgi:hypothetical protein
VILVDGTGLIDGYPEHIRCVRRKGVSSCRHRRLKCTICMMLSKELGKGSTKDAKAHRQFGRDHADCQLPRGDGRRCLRSSWWDAFPLMVRQESGQWRIELTLRDGKDEWRRKRRVRCEVASVRREVRAERADEWQTVSILTRGFSFPSARHLSDRTL